MEPLSTIASTIGVIGSILATYNTIGKIANLPKSFNEIRKQLPLVQSTLRDAQGCFNDPELPDEQVQAIMAIINPCNKAAMHLNRIFDEIETQCKGDQNENDWERVRVKYHRALRGKKAHRVEVLMCDILKGVQKLALSRELKSAMQKNLQVTEKAIEGISKTEPTLPDSDFDSPGTINASQTVAEGSNAQQNNTQGGSHIFNSAKYAINGNRHTINFGKSP